MSTSLQQIESKTGLIDDPVPVQELARHPLFEGVPIGGAFFKFGIAAEPGENLTGIGQPRIDDPAAHRAAGVVAPGVAREVADAPRLGIEN